MRLRAFIAADPEATRSLLIRRSLADGDELRDLLPRRVGPWHSGECAHCGERRLVAASLVDTYKTAGKPPDPMTQAAPDLCARCRTKFSPDGKLLEMERPASAGASLWDVMLDELEG